MDYRGGKCGNRDAKKNLEVGDCAKTVGEDEKCQACFFFWIFLPVSAVPASHLRDYQNSLGDI
jgi:hypothetical protein